MDSLKEWTDALAAFIPEKYRPLALLLGLGLLKYSPLITRSVYALMNGRGIKGVLSAIWLGTNTPKQSVNQPISESVNGTPENAKDTKDQTTP